MTLWRETLHLEGLCIQRGALFWQHSFSLNAGQLLVLMGESGSGKTSLLECLGGFLPAQSGQARYGKQSLLSLPPQRRPVSSLFQQHNLFEHLSVAQNLSLGFQRGKPTPEQWRRVLEACEQLGVIDLIQRKPDALSGGQRQRIALIRTVLRDQPVLLLDEPFSALDEATRHTAGDWLRRELDRRGQACLMVSHQQADSQRWADQSIQL